jgi:hypothetical protein
MSAWRSCSATLCSRGLRRRAECRQAKRTALWSRQRSAPGGRISSRRTSYVNDTASEGLRKVCSQPYAFLIDLERVAAEVGLDKDQLHWVL